MVKKSYPECNAGDNLCQPGPTSVFHRLPFHDLPVSTPSFSSLPPHLKFSDSLIARKDGSLPAATVGYVSIVSPPVCVSVP